MPQDGSPASAALSFTKISFDGSSTLKASAATMQAHPSPLSSDRAESTPPLNSPSPLTKRNSVLSILPPATSIGGTSASALAFIPSTPVPVAIMPTGDTSPSKSALVACVVLWATKTISSPASLSLIAENTLTTPAATPSAALCVVGDTA